MNTEQWLQITSDTDPKYIGMICKIHKMDWRDAIVWVLDTEKRIVYEGEYKLITGDK